MRRESTCVHLPLPNIFLPKAHMAGKLQISPHFLIQWQEIFLFFLKHERGPTWEKKKEKEKRGNWVVSSVHDCCMTLSHFNELFLSWVCTSFCNLQDFHDIIIIIIIKFVAQFVAFCKSHGLFFPLGFCIVCCCKKFMNFSFLPFGLHDFVCWVFFWDAWFVVWWCCILQICEGRFFFFLWVAWVCCCILLQDCEVGLWHDQNVAFCICVNLFSSFLWVHGFLVAFCRSMSIFFGVLGSHMIVVAACRFLRFVLTLCSVWFGCCIL